MSITAETLLIVVLLVPGFWAAYLARVLGDPNQPWAYNHLVLAVVVSLISYLVSDFVLQTSVLADISNLGGDEHALEVETLFYRNVPSAWAIATFLGVAVGYASSKDWIYEFLHWLGLTNNVSGKSLWPLVFQRHSRKWLQVIFADGRLLVGWSMYYSNFRGEYFLFLSNAVWHHPILRISKDGETRTAGYREKKVIGDGVIVRVFDGILAIEVLEPEGRENATETGDSPNNAS